MSHQTAQDKPQASNLSHLSPPFFHIHVHSSTDSARSLHEKWKFLLQLNPAMSGERHGQIDEEDTITFVYPSFSSYQFHSANSHPAPSCPLVMRCDQPHSLDDRAADAMFSSYATHQTASFRIQSPKPFYHRTTAVSSPRSIKVCRAKLKMSQLTAHVTLQLSLVVLAASWTRSPARAITSSSASISSLRTLAFTLFPLHYLNCLCIFN